MRARPRVPALVARDSLPFIGAQQGTRPFTTGMPGVTSSGEWDMSMKRDLTALTAEHYDLAVVGGGFFGICAAWDAVLRGLSVVVVDKGDFCGATSANSFKIVHGGIRYVQHGDVARVRASCRERSALLRVAPHLVQPLPIVIPTYGHGKNGKALLSAGLLTYDLLTLDRNRGIRDPKRRIPRSRLICKGDVLEAFPGLQQEGLTGGALFYDGQMYNPTRLAMSFLRSAVSAGAHAANYIEATGFLVSNGRVAGIKVHDHLTGDRFEIRARSVLNAAGPWAERLLSQSLGLSHQKPSTYSRDACFVVKRRLEGPYALAAQGRTQDPDAILSRDARHLFVVPWRDYSLIGVWHVVYRGAPDRVTVTAGELETFVDEMNWAYPGLELTLDDVLSWNAGLVPFGENRPGATNLSYGKRSILIDHAQRHNLPGLVTLIGIRYTMARGDAARAIDIIAKQLGLKTARAPTDRRPVHGGSIEDFDLFVERTQSAIALPPRMVRALVHNYGSEYRRVLGFANTNPALTEPVPGSTVLKAEVLHAVHEEMAFTLADVVLRRTDLGTAQYPGKKALRICADLMGGELGWTAARIEQEISEVARLFPSIARAGADEPAVGTAIS